MAGSSSQSTSVKRKRLPTDTMDLFNLPSASSKLVKEEYSFIWTVENCSELREQLVSSVFQDGSNQWRMVIIPAKKSPTSEADDQLNATWIGVHLNNDSKESVTADVEITFIKSGEKKASKNLQSLEFLSGKPCKKSYMYFYPEAINEATKNNGDTLEILCRISSVVKWVHSSVKNAGNGNMIAKKEETMRKKLEEFWTDGEFSDIVVTTGADIFPVSKIILASQSPVFDAMFKSGMTEASDNVVTIPDFPSETVKGMLNFLYTGTTNTLTNMDNAMDLLRISDKYQLSLLKQECEETVLANLTPDNAVEILILAHFYSPTTLKQKVVAFVNRFKTQVQATDSFKKMAIDHPDVFLDLYTALQ